MPPAASTSTPTPAARNRQPTPVPFEAISNLLLEDPSSRPRFGPPANITHTGDQSKEAASPLSLPAQPRRSKTRGPCYRFLFEGGPAVKGGGARRCLLASGLSGWLISLSALVAQI